MSVIAGRISALLATAALALGYGLHGIWTGAAFAILIGLFSLAGEWRGWAWAVPAGLILFQSSAGLGLWLKLEPGWMLLAAVSGLSAADLAWFRQRAQGLPRSAALSQLERQHLCWLLAICESGLLFGALALSLKLTLGLGTAILLALLAIFGLSRVVASLGHPDRAKPDQPSRPGSPE